MCCPFDIPDVPVPDGCPAKPLAFVDVDGTLYKHGTDEWLPGVRAKLIELAKRYRICLFTCRGPGAWILPIVEAIGREDLMYVQKPWAERYAIFDDRLWEASPNL